ncbi:MAG: hypothetical protein ACE5LC_02195 [Candidatus Aminicenantales bacterium]
MKCGAINLVTKKTGLQKMRRKYETPRIISYSSDDILKELGPAQACSPYWGAQSPESAPPGYAPGMPPPFYEPPEKRKKQWWEN